MGNIHIARTCFILLLCLNSFSLNANWGAHLLDREKKGMSVPSYCKAKFKDRFPHITDRQVENAREFLGESFLHVHHFCWGLVHIWDLEAGGVPNEEIAGQAIKEITYFYSRTPQDHAVMRDVHRAYSTAYRYSGDSKKSREHYKKSLQLSAYRSAGSGRPGNTNLPSASASRYVEMADKMMRIGIPEEAAELLELALKIEPKSQLIKAKLKAARAAQERRGHTE